MQRTVTADCGARLSQVKLLVKTYNALSQSRGERAERNRDQLWLAYLELLDDAETFDEEGVHRHEWEHLSAGAGQRC